MYKFPSALDQQLWDSLMVGEHWFNVRVRINNVYYPQGDLMDMSTDVRMFCDEQPTVGACLAGELTLKMLKPSAAIPRMAKVEPFVQATDGTEVSAWMPQGVYYIDTREESKNDDGLDMLTMHCYDAMLKSEAPYPSTTHSWANVYDTDTVKEIAYFMGLQSSASSTDGIDARTWDVMTGGYKIPLPAGYTMREVLSYIAGMYAGNWVMTLEGKLLLVTISGIPEETSLLVNEAGNVITFGLEPGTEEEVAISIANTTV